MTKQRKAKQAARALSQAAGISYTAARRATSGSGGGGSGRGNDTGPSEPDDGWDHDEPMSVVELVRSSLQDACDRLFGETIRPRGNNGSGAISVDFDLPRDMSEPTVHEFVIEENSVDVHVDEEFEGGTLACNVMANATLTVEALMAKPDAYASAESGLVRILEADINDHYSSVLFHTQVEITFLAIVNPDYESVEDLTFDGAVSIEA